MLDGLISICRHWKPEKRIPNERPAERPAEPRALFSGCDGQTGEDDDGDRIGHVAADPTRRVMVIDGARREGVVPHRRSGEQETGVYRGGGPAISHVGPLARRSFRSSAAKRQSSASARAMYQAS